MRARHCPCKVAVSRRSFLETDYPITGARVVSADDGLTLGDVIDRLANRLPAGDSWNTLIRVSGDENVELLRKPDFDSLSDYEVELLDAVFDEFGEWPAEILAKYTRGLAEWMAPRKEVAPVAPEQILRAAGRSDEEIENVAERVESIRSFTSMLAAVE